MTPPAPPRRLAAARGPARRRAPAAPPGEPWLADHPWRRDGAVDLTGLEGRKALMAGGLVTLVASAAAAALLPEVEWPIVAAPVLIFGVMLALGLWLLWRGVRAVQGRARHGVSELRFARFPYHLGEPLDVTLVREGATARLDGLAARLCCVQERLERGTGVSDSTHGDDSYVREVTWSETRPLPGPAGARVALRLQLPAAGPGVAGTALSADPPRYWELEVWADLPGLDFHAVFLVPVYQRPATARLDAPGA